MKLQSGKRLSGSTTYSKDCSSSICPQIRTESRHTHIHIYIRNVSKLILQEIWFCISVSYGRVWFKCALHYVQSSSCLKTHSFPRAHKSHLLSHIHIHKEVITPKTSRHLYCWPDSQASSKRCSEMCSSASCLTGTPDLLRITDFSLSELESISSRCISAKQRLRKRVLYKIYGLREGAVNYKARNTRCYSWFCSVLTFCY